MPFQYILANLLAQNDGAVGVLFLDDTGETDDFACSEYSPYLHVEKEGLHLYSMPLPDGYYLVLVQRRPALAGLARRTMEEACDQLQRALFVQG